jgi:hypothetical protein
VQSASVRGRQVRSPVLPQHLLRRLVAVPERSSRIRKVASREERVDEQEPRAAESAEGSGDGADSRHSELVKRVCEVVKCGCAACLTVTVPSSSAALCQQLLHLRREPTRARRPPFCNLLISSCRFRTRPTKRFERKKSETSKLAFCSSRLYSIAASEYRQRPGKVRGPSQTPAWKLLARVMVEYKCAHYLFLFFRLGTASSLRTDRTRPLRPGHSKTLGSDVEPILGSATAVARLGE